MAKGGVCDVYLVGTLPGNKESSKQVEEIVKFLKPEIVFLALCSDRQEVLFHDNIEALTMGGMNAMSKEKYSISQKIISQLDAEIERLTEVYPFAEFRLAYKEAIKYGGIVVLGDRRLEITFERTWSKLRLWHILKLLIANFPSTFSAYLSHFDNLPTVRETMVHERDRYMSHTLLTVARKSRTVVAVVGERHLEGMKKNWKQPIEIQELLELRTIPPPKPAIPAMRLFAIVGIAVAGVTIISTIYH